MQIHPIYIACDWHIDQYFTSAMQLYLYSISQKSLQIFYLIYRRAINVLKILSEIGESALELSAEQVRY